MNLLLFSVEIERGRVGKLSAEHRSEAVSSQWHSRLPWVGLVVVGVLCVTAAACGGWMLASGAAIDGLPDWIPHAAESLEPGSEQARLEITSQPDHATVIVDGHSRGQTPLSLLLAHGEHSLVLRHPEALDEQRKVSVSSDLHMQVSMWLRRPAAVQLRSAYPGASIADAVFLADGRLALSMAAPTQPGDAAGGLLHEPWLFDPTVGSLTPFVDTASAQAAAVSISPDGRSLAYLHQDQPGGPNGVTRKRLDTVWIAGAAAGGAPVRVFSLPTLIGTGTVDAASNEVGVLQDVTWTPDGRHLLIAVRLVAVSGGVSVSSQNPSAVGGHRGRGCCAIMPG